MVFKLIFTPQAEREWVNVIEWYNEKKERLGYEVYEEIRESIKRVKANPLHFQIRFNDIRAIFTKRFHFGVYYIVENEFIYVISVLHNREDDAKILGRKI